MQLTGENVKEVFSHCLFELEEDTSNAVMVDGITGRFGLHPTRLNEKKIEIQQLIDQLPVIFIQSNGGGNSFMNMVNDRGGNQWTDYHRDAEMLLVLGVAVGMIEYCAPKELWPMLPGGMPYFYIKDSVDQKINAQQP